MTTRAITGNPPAMWVRFGLLTIFLLTLVSACARQAPTSQDPLLLSTKTLESNLNQRMTQTVPGAGAAARAANH